MAGLQYYFFPTDFFYPKPQSVIQESSSSLQQAVPPGIQTQSPKQDLKMNDAKKTNSLTVRQTRNANLIKTSTFSLKLRKPVKPLHPKPATDSGPN